MAKIYNRLETFKAELRKLLKADTTLEGLTKLVREGKVSRTGIHPTSLNIAIKDVFSEKAKKFAKAEEKTVKPAKKGKDTSNEDKTPQKDKEPAPTPEPDKTEVIE